MVTSMPKLQIDHEAVCKGYSLWTKFNKSFPSSENRAKEILDMIHSDVYGPMYVKSFGGASYYVSFIDDYSHKTWVYLMKIKDEVFGEL